MNKNHIDSVLKYCKSSYNGHAPSSGYDDLYQILTNEFKNPNINPGFNTIIELGPAYTLLPHFLSNNQIKEYNGVDPFLSKRTEHAINFALASKDGYLTDHNIYDIDALSYFQDYSGIKGIIVSIDLLNRDIIGPTPLWSSPSESSQESESNVKLDVETLINNYATELTQKIYDATPDNGFTAHIFIDNFFAQKLKEAGFRRSEKYLFRK